MALPSPISTGSRNVDPALTPQMNPDPHLNRPLRLTGGQAAPPSSRRRVHAPRAPPISIPRAGSSCALRSERTRSWNAAFPNASPLCNCSHGLSTRLPKASSINFSIGAAGLENGAQGASYDSFSQLCSAGGSKLGRTGCRLIYWLALAAPAMQKWSLIQGILTVLRARLPSLRYFSTKLLTREGAPHLQHPAKSQIHHEHDANWIILGKEIVKQVNHQL